MNENIFVATARIGNDLYRTELVAGQHTIVADELESSGGKNLGPQPQDFIRMGLASCTAITLRMYANRKKMDVSQIKVSVSNGPTTDKTTYKIEILITGNISDDEKARLIQIARKCPVHKILTSPIQTEHTLTSEK